MYYWGGEYEKLVPPQEVLDKCYQICLSSIDAKNLGVPFWKIKKWAATHCKSFVWMDVPVDCWHWDELAFYYFGDERDALMFKIKYKNS
jgi:hypothetical protein